MDDFDWLSDAEVFALAAKRLAALTPTTDGEREAREALAKFDEPRCGRSLDWVIPGLRCNNVEGHAGSCSHDSRRDVRERATVVTPDHLRTTLALLAAERAKAAALSAEIAELRDPDARYRALLDWRGVETPCPTCSGSGRRGYGNTSTWRRGSGGCAITDDVCDACWGTGDAERKGADLRAKAADAARERAAIVAMLRKRAEDFANRNSGAMTDSPSTVLDDAADAIERGAHTKVTP